MRLKISPTAFSVAFCAAYCVFFFSNRPLFRYYPVHQQWVWGATDSVARSGPVMVWYGLIANAAWVSLITAVVLPEERVMSWLRGWLWLGPWLAAVACGYLLRIFFLH